MSSFGSHLRFTLLLFVAGLVLACDSTGPAAPASDLAGSYRVGATAAYTVVTTSADDAVVMSDAQSSTMSIGEGQIPFPYVSVGNDEILLSTEIGVNVSESAFPACTMRFMTSTVTSGTASDLPAPSLEMFCAEDADGEQSKFEPVGDVTYTYDLSTLTIDLPATLMRQVPDTPSRLGPEVTVGGQFTGRRVQTPAGVPTRIDGTTRLVELGLQSGSLPVDGEIDLLADGTYESRYQGPITVDGTEFSPVVERGTWSATDGTLSVTIQEVNGVEVRLQPVGALVFTYDRAGGNLMLDLSLDACSDSDPWSRSTCLGNHGRLLGLSNPDGISGLQRGLTTTLEAR